MTSLREQYPLESTKPLKKTIESSMGYLFLAIFLSVFMGVINGSLTGYVKFHYIVISIFLIMIIALTLKYIYEIFYMKFYIYDANKDILAIKKGVFSRNEINLPFKRLQDVYVDQDILDRILGLYDLHVSSATMLSGYLSHIDGLNKENSEALKNLILKRIHSKDGKK